MTTRRDFAGGDQAYLRDVQYGGTANLDARSRLHATSSTSPVGWHTWLAGQVDWPTAGTVVEVGCGTGSLWAEAVARWPPGRYVLTDQSTGMVGAALARTGGRLADAVGTVADAQSLPLADGVADVVVANHVLYHVPDVARAIAELARVARRDGLLLAATNGADHMRELTALAATVFPSMGTEPVEVSRFGRETGGELLGAAFEDVTWMRFEDALVCTEQGDVVAYLTSFPPGEQATAGERDALRAAIADAFAAGGGTLRVTKDVGAFVARSPRFS